MAYSKTLANIYAANRDKYRSSDHKVLPLLKKAGIKGKTVLDFGCGDGPEAEKFIAAGARRVVGTDPSDQMIRLAKERQIPRSLFLKTDGVTLPLKANQFDAAYARYVLHYLRDLSSQFSEISRVLKVNGYFIALFQCLTSDQLLLNKRVPILLGKGKNVTKIQILAKSTEEVRYALRAAKLKVVTFSEVKNTDSRIDPGYANKKKFKNVTYVLLAKKI